MKLPAPTGRQRGMRLSLLVVVSVLITACGADQPSASPAPSTLPPFQQLPESVAGIPGPDTPSAVLAPQSERGGWGIGATQPLMLGHCGLASPLDFDGSLWDPMGGHDGSGGPLSDEQVGDLINATDVRVTLIDPATAVLVTVNGAVVRVERHAGPREYPLCD